MAVNPGLEQNVAPISRSQHYRENERDRLKNRDVKSISSNRRGEKNGTERNNVGNDRLGPSGNGRSYSRRYDGDNHYNNRTID